MPKTFFAFKLKNNSLKALHYALHPFAYHAELETEIIDFKEREFFAIAEGNELKEALGKFKRHVKSFRITAEHS